MPLSRAEFGLVSHSREVKEITDGKIYDRNVKAAGDNGYISMTIIHTNSFYRQNSIFPIGRKSLCC